MNLLAKIIMITNKGARKNLSEKDSRKTKRMLSAMLLVLCLVGSGIFSGCSLSSTDVTGDNGSEEALINSIIKQYNSENKVLINSKDIEVLEVKAYGSDYLVLCSYEVKDEKEAVLLEISRRGSKYKVVNEAHGVFSKDYPSVCSVEYKDMIIYFGNIPKITGDAFALVSVKLDDGSHISESIKENQKGYIVTAKANTSIVDYNFKKSSGEVHYFIKDFINFGPGIHECQWSQPR